MPPYFFRQKILDPSFFTRRIIQCFYHSFLFSFCVFFQEGALTLSIFPSSILDHDIIFGQKRQISHHSFSAEQPRPHPFLFGKTSHYPFVAKAAPIPISFAACLTSYDARTYTLKFCLFHTFGDILASLFTFMGTGIFCMLIVFNWNPDVKLSKKKQSKCLLTVYQL